MSSLIICARTQYCSGDQIEKNELGETCSSHVGEEGWVQDFGEET
jgi:hypothetical protein